MSDKIINKLLNYDYGFKFGFNFKTDISQTIGGGEQRRGRWLMPLRKYSIPYNDKAILKLKDMYMFLYEHRGALADFLFYDTNSRMKWLIESGYKAISNSAVDKIYLPVRYLVPKSYDIGANIPEVYPSNLTLNLTEDVLIYVNDIQRTTDTTIDANRGEITFTANKPASTAKIEVEYAYLTRVRSTDNFDITENTYSIGTTALELTEVR